ncbi:thymidine kinase [Actinomyces mediterranea]|uniref:thymidine kinase n=1 Tax=Actinomyces mediterranea TaxID=1871028 RepID=UPI0009710106|nr:thymidine kinase [Actinomyces mediterranea]
MAKLYFRYGAMNSGKSTALLQAAYNYEERGQRVLVAKPMIDAKGDSLVVSRLGVSREADVRIGPDTDVYALMESLVDSADAAAPIACLLVDEAQFLSEAQIDDLLHVTVALSIPVIAYGIRTDFQTLSFPGSRRLLEIAHSLEELKTICRCGRKAMFNGRKTGGKFVFDGEQVAIDGIEVTYESMCPACYLAAGGSLPYRGARDTRVV